MRVVVVGTTRVHGHSMVVPATEYQPRYTSLQAVYESVSWPIHRGVIDSPPLH